MDIRNYTWVNSFEYNKTKQSPSENNDVIKIVAIVVTISGVVIIVIGFLIYKYKTVINRSKSEIGDVILIYR